MELPDIEQVALAQSLDVQGATPAAKQTANKLGGSPTPARRLPASTLPWRGQKPPAILHGGNVDLRK